MVVGDARTATTDQIAGFTAQERDLGAAGAVKSMLSRSPAWRNVPG